MRRWLDERAIRLDFAAAGWEEAVAEAGRLLEMCGAARPGYARAMVEMVREFGPYIVIAPGIALPHARPEAGANRAALSFVRLRQPVNFGHESNDPVDLVFGLVAINNDAHVGLMASLAGALQDPDILSALRAAATPAEVLQVLTGPTGQP